MAGQPRIDGYTSLERIARGGFGTVYRARQERFGRVVALKVLDVEALDDDARRRFERECVAMGGLSWHPNVVALHDSGLTPDGRPYLVMEYLEAGSLGDRLSQGPLAWPHAVRAGVEVAGALGASHAAGTLHRDLKPENLLVGPFGETKLGDFGIAAVEGAARTAGGAISLTIAHVAPEVLRGEEPDERSDVYALASTLHTLLAGEPPYDNSGTLGDVIARVLHTPPPRLDRVPDDLAAVVHRGLAKDPSARPAGAAALGRALQGVQATHRHPVTALRLTPGSDEPLVPPPPAPVDTTAPPPPAPPPVEGPRRPAAPAPGGTMAPGPPSRPTPPWATPLIIGIAAVTGVAVMVVVVAVAIMMLGRYAGSDGTPSSASTSDDTPGTTAAAPSVTATVAVGAGPEQVALTDDAVWVVNSEDATVSRIDLTTDEVVATIAVGTSPFGLAATEGAVWVGNSEAGTVSRIDPATDDVVATITLRSFPGGIAADEDDVWVAGFDDGSVTRIDATTNRVAGIIDVGSPLNGIALTEDAVWVASPSAGTVTRIDRATEQVAATIDLGIDVQPNGVTASADAVWVSGFANDSVTRIDPATDDVVATVEVGNQVNGVATTGTKVWVANQADGTLSEIDVATNEVVATVDVGDTPNGVDATDEVVWTTNFQPGTATRLDPTPD